MQLVPTWGSSTRCRAGPAGPRSASDCHPVGGWPSTVWPGWAAPGPEPPGPCPAPSSLGPPRLAPLPAATPSAPRCTLVWSSGQSKYVYCKMCNRFSYLLIVSNVKSMLILTASSSPTHCRAFFFTDTAGSLQRSDSVARFSQLRGITLCFRRPTRVCVEMAEPRG